MSVLVYHEPAKDFESDPKEQQMPYTKFYLIAITLVFAIAAKGSASDEQTSEPRKTFTTTSYSHTGEQTDMPVLRYGQRRGHHGQWIAGDDTNIEEILIWKDGTIVWHVVGDDRTLLRFATHTYQTTIPAEKVEAALRDIAESFAKYPVKDRPWESRIFFSLGANSSPSLTVRDSRHYGSMWMDDWLLRFYQHNREIFQSNDTKTIVATIKRGIPSHYNGHRGFVQYYREAQPNAGLSGLRFPFYSDAEILKCVRLWAADAEHLLLMERKVLDLLPFTEGLTRTAKQRDTQTQYLHVEREIKDGKSEFFYSRVSEREFNEIRTRLRAERERQ